MQKWIITILMVMMMVNVVSALDLTTNETINETVKEVSFDFLKEDGWGDAQVIETKDYTLSTFHNDYHCGLGHCEVSFYFNTSILVFDKLDFKANSDVELKNVVVKKVLGENNETSLTSLSLVQANETNYYKLYFDYEPVWTKGIIKRVKDVKFNISAYVGLTKVLELDPIAHQSVSGGITSYIDTLGIEWSHTIDCNDDLVLIVGVATDSDVQDQVTGITYNGKSLSKLLSLQSADGQVVGDYWNLSDPDCGGSYLVSVTGNAHEDAAGVSTAYAFVDYINNDSMTYDRSDSSSSASIIVTTTSAEELVVDMLALDVDPTANAGGDNQVERHEVDENDVQMSTSDGWNTGGTVTMSWSGFTDEWVLIGVPLIPAPDTRAPVWSINTDNSSAIYPFVNDYVETKVNWSDKYAINYTWFSSNFTGSWVNGSLVPANGNLSTYLTENTQATAEGKTVCWTFYANDSAGNLNQSSTDCFLVYKYGMLNVRVSFPEDNTSVAQNTTFDLNVSVTCTGGEGALCGLVSALARYNFSTGSPDTTINSSTDLSLSGGVSLDDPCYQETANESHINDGSCGLDYSGSYSCQGTWIGDCSATFDGDFDTFDGASGFDTTSLFVNYTKPENAFNATWKVKDSSGNINLTIPLDCWNQNPLQLKVNSIGIAGTVEWYCWDGDGFDINLRAETGGADIYEEAIYWNISGSGGASNPITSSETLENGENFNASWTINATGLNSTQWLIDVLFNSTTYFPNILTNSTEDRRVCIGDCPSEGTPPVGDTCSPTSPLSADHTYLCSDDCEVTSDLDVNGYNLYFTGAGMFTLNSAVISNFRKVVIGDGVNPCKSIAENGGHFVGFG